VDINVVFGSKVSVTDTLYLVSLLRDFLLTRVSMVFVLRSCIGMLIAFRLVRREDLLNCVLAKYYATSSAVRCYSNKYYATSSAVRCYSNTPLQINVDTIEES
jgi:hypothetical protein